MALQVGLTATPQYLQKLTYLCWNHDSRILQIDTVRCAPYSARPCALANLPMLSQDTVATTFNPALRTQPPTPCMTPGKGCEAGGIAAVQGVQLR